MVEASPVRVVLISPDPSLAVWMLEDVGALETEGGCGRVNLFGHEWHFQSLNTPPPQPIEADLVIGLVRYVDVLSLQALDELYRAIAADPGRPAGFLVYRNENEADFKMSCPYCGQKLWVRDADLDKRGRCPNCKRGFTLPNQEAHLTACLHLPAHVPVRRVVRGDAASFSAPLQNLLRLRRVDTRKDPVLTHPPPPSPFATMAVQVSPTLTKNG